MDTEKVKSIVRQELGNEQSRNLLLKVLFRDSFPMSQSETKSFIKMKLAKFLAHDIIPIIHKEVSETLKTKTSLQPIFEKQKSELESLSSTSIDQARTKIDRIINEEKNKMQRNISSERDKLLRQLSSTTQGSLIVESVEKKFRSELFFYKATSILSLSIGVCTSSFLLYRYLA